MWQKLYTMTFAKSFIDWCGANRNPSVLATFPDAISIWSCIQATELNVFEYSLTVHIYSKIRWVCTCARPQPAPCCTAGQGACSWGACHWCRRKDSRLPHGAPLQRHTLLEKCISLTDVDRNITQYLSLLHVSYRPDSSRWCSCWLPVSDVWLRMSDMRAELSALPANRLIPDMGSAWS